ncbi:hypothetical protein OTU49_003372 [Cherax quadricarinatus]|uniref:Uncharacterized protein n=1 Tax=Cherax quadricarinatus TaxID=27406 RepID=A0AAW0XJQ1_CHEQU
MEELFPHPLRSIRYPQDPGHSLPPWQELFQLPLRSIRYPQDPGHSLPPWQELFPQPLRSIRYPQDPGHSLPPWRYPSLKATFDPGHEGEGGVALQEGSQDRGIAQVPTLVEQVQVLVGQTQDLS